MSWSAIFISRDVSYVEIFATVQKIQNLEETHGDEWVSVWLESRGLSLADYQGEAA
mgnify:CR=1 FL=1